MGEQARSRRRVHGTAAAAGCRVRARAAPPLALPPLPWPLPVTRAPATVAARVLHQTPRRMLQERVAAEPVAAGRGCCNDERRVRARTSPPLVLLPASAPTSATRYPHCRHPPYPFRRHRFKHTLFQSLLRNCFFVLPPVAFSYSHSDRENRF